MFSISHFLSANQTFQSSTIIFRLRITFTYLCGVLCPNKDFKDSSRSVPASTLTRCLPSSAGYSSLNEGAHTPMYPGAAGRQHPPSLSSPSAEAAEGKLAPRCWRTVYLLLDLYANMPDADTITHRLFSVFLLSLLNFNFKGLHSLKSGQAKYKVMATFHILTLFCWLFIYYSTNVAWQLNVTIIMYMWLKFWEIELSLE